MQVSNEIQEYFKRNINCPEVLEKSMHNVEVVHLSQISLFNSGSARVICVLDITLTNYVLILVMTGNMI